MNNTTQNNISNFLKNLPKSEIISILHAIDDKISSLHTTSSKDFLYFNKLLKEYYKKIKDISEANNSISSFFRKDLSFFVDAVKNSNTQQNKYLRNIDQNISFLINKLSLVYSSFDLIVVPYNNFKQNLITLKYILANINLHLAYIDLPNKDLLKENVDRLNKLINSASINNEKSAKKTHDLVNNILNLKSNTYILKNNTEVSEHIKKLELELGKLDKEEFWPDNFIHRINTHTQNCFANMGEIITNLQYHDIIRQKMEHIQSSQKELITNLNDLNNNSNEIEDQLKVVVSIPEITEIQVAQLLYTNKDYQTSIEKISSRLIEVGRELKDLNAIYENLSGHTEIFQNIFMRQLSATQNSYKNHKKQFNLNWQKTALGIQEIVSQYNDLKGNFNNVFIEEKNIRNEIKTFEKIIKENGKNFSSDLVNRLFILISDLKLNSNSLKNSLNNITTHVNSLNNITADISEDSEQKELSKTVISNLDKNILAIKHLGTSYANNSLTIANEITNALNNIEYYNYFEQIVEDIVKMLNLINEKINYSALNKDAIDDKDILNRIEKLYTMKSERDIHNKLTSTGLNASEILLNDNNNDTIDDGDIELF